MQGLILAAGAGSRLQDKGPSKPLVEFMGRPLLEWALLAAKHAGIDEFVLVLGHMAEDLECAAARLASKHEVPIRTVYNPDWREANGLSVLAARALLADRFYLSMCDHLLDPALIAGLVARARSDEGENSFLAVDLDLNNPLVDLDDVTRVRLENGHIRAIGKFLDGYNAFDTGAFVAHKSLCDAIAESARRSGDGSLSGGMRVLGEQDRALGHNIDGKFWIDVDDPAAYERARGAIKASGLRVFADIYAPEDKAPA